MLKNTFPLSWEPSFKMGKTSLKVFVEIKITAVRVFEKIQ